ncbi:MAG: DUF2795 domain-containing protein [Kineosporiaceae bacterium]
MSESTTPGFEPTTGQQSGARGPRQDEQLKHETAGLVQGGHSSRAEEWRDPEPAGEDQPTGDVGILPEDRRGTPPGMTSGDVEHRSLIARHLGTSAFPGDRDQLIDVASTNSAPDSVVADLTRLPSGKTFANVQDVARELGIGVEDHRV